MRYALMYPHPPSGDERAMERQKERERERERQREV